MEQNEVKTTTTTAARVSAVPQQAAPGARARPVLPPSLAFLSSKAAVETPFSVHQLLQ